MYMRIKIDRGNQNNVHWGCPTTRRGRKLNSQWEQEFRVYECSMLSRSGEYEDTEDISYSFPSSKKIEINDETLKTRRIERVRGGKKNCKNEKKWNKRTNIKRSPVAFVSMQYSGFYCKIMYLHNVQSNNFPYA